jgi:hypothetical protein
LAPDTLDGPEIEAAMFAAEAQVEILRVRRAKVDLVNRAANHLRDEDARALPPCERATMGFAQKSKTLVAFDRYERRALSRRNQALRRLRTLQRLEAISRKKSADAVGPPRCAYSDTHRRRPLGHPVPENPQPGCTWSPARNTSNRGMP